MRFRAQDLSGIRDLQPGSRGRRRFRELLSQQLCLGVCSEFRV